MEEHSHGTSSNVCQGCGCGSWGCGCGGLGGYMGGMHGGRHFILRLVLGLLIIAMVFALGVKVGEFKGYIESNYPSMGYGHRIMINDRIGGMQNMMWTNTAPDVTPIP